MIVSEPDKTPSSDAPVSPPEQEVTTHLPEALAKEPLNATAANDLPDWEPLTPELVEDEAIRGDFMLRWVVVLLALLIGCRQIVETTTLVHVKTGRYLASHGFWPPSKDVFTSSAAEHHWINLSWLWDLISSGLFAIGNGIGLSLGTALLTALTWWLLGKTSRPGVPTWFGSILGVVALLACHAQFSGQPETVTLVGLAATLWLLCEWRNSQESLSSGAATVRGRPTSLWWLVPGFVLWSNLDSRMFLGLTLLLLWGIGEAIGSALGRSAIAADQRAQFWRIVGTCIVVSTLNPFGLHSLLAPISLYGREYPAWRLYVSSSSGLEETGAFPLLTSDLWQSAVGRLPLVSGVAVLLSTLVSLVLNGRRANFGDVLAFVGFVVLALAASHELAAASVVACVIGAWNAQQWYQTGFQQTYSIETKELLFTRGGRALTVLAFFALAVMSVNQSLFGPDGKRMGIGLSRPLRAMIDAYRDATANSFDDRPFNFVPRQGDVLLWVDQKPFLDSRLALFAKQGEIDLLTLHDQARRSLAAMDDQRTDLIPAKSDSVWQPIFDRYQLTHAMPRLFGGNPTAYFRMLVSPHWRLTHLGSHCAVFYRRDTVSTELTQFQEQHQLDLRKVAFQTTEPTPLRIDWPRRRTTFQRWFSSTEPQVSNRVLTADNLLLHLRAIAGGHVTIDQPTAVAIAHLAIRNANAGLAESVDDAVAYQILAEAYSFLLNVENGIELRSGIPFENRMRFYQALGAYYQALLLEPNSFFLRERLLELLVRHNRLDLVLRELQAIEQLTAVTNSDHLEGSESQERRASLREYCESRQATMKEQLQLRMDQGQSGVEFAAQVYSAGFVLEALRLLNLDAEAVRQSPELQNLQRLLRFESGEIEEMHDLFEYESEENVSAWRTTAAWTRLAHGEYEKAIELWTNQSLLTERTSVSAVLATLPMIQSPFHSLEGLNVWPTQHDFLFNSAQLVIDSENSTLLWYRAMGQLEGGNPQLAAKTMAGLLETNPDSTFRPLVRFYLFAVNDEQIDLEPPSEWIPIDAEIFMPDEPDNTQKK